MFRLLLMVPVDPGVLLLVALALLALVVIVGEIVAALRQAKARREGRPGVGLIVRSDASATVPEDVDTQGAGERTASAAAETAIDLHAQAQQYGAELDNLFDDEEDEQSAIDELNRALEDAQREIDGDGDSDSEPADGTAAQPETQPTTATAVATASASIADDGPSVPPAAEVELEVEAETGTTAGTPNGANGNGAARERPYDETRIQFPVSPAGPAAATVAESVLPAAADDAAADADTGRYDVVLEQRPADEATRIHTIRIVRRLLGNVPLFDVMLRIDQAPSRVAHNLSRREADAAVQQLAAIGANASRAAHEPQPEASANANADAPAPPADAEGAIEVADGDLEAMAARAAAKGKAKKKRKTFAEYEEDRRRLIAKREAEKAERQARWRERLAHEVLFVGRGVSAGLNKHEYDAEKLKRFDLPRLGSAEQVCQAMGISPTTMRWLCFHREDAQTEHYHRFTIPKKSGGEREISSPKPALRQAQRWVLDNVLAKVAISDVAHGFVPGRSTRSNAEPHQRAACVIKLDVRDFFPTITFPRVKGLLHRSLGFGEAAATVMALICTEPPRVTAAVDEAEYRVAVGQRQLPQGACTSPAITNIVCRRLDARLRGLAAKFGFTYTRYADDLTMSGPTGDRKVVGQLIGGAKRILREEGFAAHEEKIGVHRRGRQQRVTGIVVNEKLSLDRRMVRRLRAVLHDTLHNGPEQANRENIPNFFGWLQGTVAYLHMVDPERAKPFREQLNEIRAKYYAG